MRIFFLETAKNIARRHRPTALRLLNIVNTIKGARSTLRIRAARKKLQAVNIVRRDRRVVFVSDRPSQREAKLAFGLKRAGWDVIQLHRYSPGFSDRSHFAEFQQFSSPSGAAELTLQFPGSVFHVFSLACDDTAVALVNHKPGRLVVDFYDHLYSRADGSPALEAQFQVDIAREKHCLTNADAVCCRDLQMQYRRRTTQAARGKPVIYFPEYCWNTQHLDTRRNDDEIHIASIGRIGLETRGEIDHGCLLLAEKFVEAGCHIDLFVHPAFPPMGSKSFESLFADYLELGAKTGRVHLHPTEPADTLISKLTCFDYGLNMTNAMFFDVPWSSHNTERFKLCGSSRLFDYLDAGLGLVSGGSLHLMLRQFSPFGVVLDGTKLMGSGRIWETLIQKPSREVILKARDALSIDRQIGRLTGFYERL